MDVTERSFLFQYSRILCINIYKQNVLVSSALQTANSGRKLEKKIDMCLCVWGDNNVQVTRKKELLYCAIDEKTGITH